MKIKVNGKQKKLPQNSVSVVELLHICSAEMPEMVSVQLNGEFVDKNNYGTTTVKEDDEIDFLYFMGGGNG